MRKRVRFPRFFAYCALGDPAGGEKNRRHPSRAKAGLAIFMIFSFQDLLMGMSRSFRP
jgi:hypothetical protein